jgi:hypothetical protein
MKKEDFVVGELYAIRVPQTFREATTLKNVDVPQYAQLTFEYFHCDGRRYKTFAETKGHYAEPVFSYNGQMLRHGYGDSRYFEPLASSRNTFHAPNARALRAKNLRRRIEEANNTIKEIDDLIQRKNQERMALTVWLGKAKTQVDNLENYPDDNAAMTDMINKIQGTGELTKEKLAEIVASFAIV